MTSEPSAPARLTREVQICNARGLHARASACFVKSAAAFDARIQVSKDDLTVGGTSIMGLMMLAASKGTTISISAEGEQAEDALNALEALVSDRFGEKD